MKRAAASPPPTTSKAAKRRAVFDPEIVHDVNEYLERFSAGEKQRGGTAKNHKPCQELVAQMKEVVSSSGPGAARLHEVIVAYGVSRCFSASSCGMKKTGGPSAQVSDEEQLKRREFMLSHLERVVQHLRDAWPSYAGLQRGEDGRAAAAVDALVDAIKSEFQKKNLSAASKLLNMLGLELPIYDSLARTALGFTKDVSYSDYLIAWSDSYEPLRAGYLAAMRASLSSRGVDISGVTEEWLCMRAHDVRLMRRGK